MGFHNSPLTLPEAQWGLFREDVRDVFSLSQSNMDNYILVGALIVTWLHFFWKETKKRVIFDELETTRKVMRNPPVRNGKKVTKKELGTEMWILPSKNWNLTGCNLTTASPVGEVR